MKATPPDTNRGERGRDALHFVVEEDYLAARSSPSAPVGWCQSNNAEEEEAAAPCNKGKNVMEWHSMHEEEGYRRKMMVLHAGG